MTGRSVGRIELGRLTRAVVGADTERSATIHVTPTGLRILLVPPLASAGVVVLVGSVYRDVAVTGDDRTALELEGDGNGCLGRMTENPREAVRVDRGVQRGQLDRVRLERVGDGTGDGCGQRIAIDIPLTDTRIPLPVVETRRHRVDVDPVAVLLCVTQFIVVNLLIVRFGPTDEKGGRTVSLAIHRRRRGPRR